MPRTARIKAESGRYHIVVRSLKELDLFKENEDKIKYLKLIKKYEIKYRFKVYAYCLMKNHGHLIIDEKSSNISTIMQVINFCYAQYFNRKYDRYGPVFQARFKSIPINNKRYMMTLSAYIHNNPKDIPKYKNNVKAYPFSSLKDYLNKTDSFGILERSFLENLLEFECDFSKDKYEQFVKESISQKMEYEVEFLEPDTEYLSHKVIIAKYHSPSEIMEYISNYLSQESLGVYVKYKRRYTKMRALACFFMSLFCNFTQKEICEILGNITQSGVSYLTNLGIDIVIHDREILDNFVV